jgi:hypothetical protein
VSAEQVPSEAELAIASVCLTARMSTEQVAPSEAEQEEVLEV